MLVAAFQVHVGLPRVFSLRAIVLQFGAAHQHGARGRAGIDPDIERITGFADGFGAEPAFGFDF
jgi:hypothetical protein